MPYRPTSLRKLKAVVVVSTVIIAACVFAWRWTEWVTAFPVTEEPPTIRIILEEK